MIKITDKTKCCGCSACAQICPKQCIEMKEDKEGFLYPSIDKDSCVNCHLCEKVCPILNYNEISSNLHQKAVIVQHKDTDICRQSTAGGAFTAIAEYVIDHEGIVFGVEMQPDFSICHIGVKTKAELQKFRNSKYVQSDVRNTYNEAKRYLDNGHMVCYSGTPCQIEGLRHYLHKDYENLILVDVVCRAVPSPGIWEKYMAMVNGKFGQIKIVRFRDKTLGYQYSTMELKSENGKVYRGGIESQPWLRMFFSGMIIRPSCTECKFRSQYRKSDFTIWDCFNVNSIDKGFNENIGTTRVLIHSKKGKAVFDKIKDNFKYKVIPVETAVNGVQEMISSPKANPHKKEFFLDVENMDMEELLNKYFPVTVKIRLKKNIRILLNYVGLDKTLKHILRKG